MFEKLLSQLPYNPGLAHQVSFYSRRMREEASIRRIGMIFIVLAFFVQFFAVLSPPQPSVAASSNDLINGGISSAADAARHCNNNTQHFKNILQNYGITCGQVANANTVNINSSGQDFYSFGRNPQGFNSEQAVNIPNLGNIYVRKLSAWGHNVSYRALQLNASTGKGFWIIYDCANLVSIGVPQPVGQTGGGTQPIAPPVGLSPNQPVSKPAPTPAPAPTPTPTPPTPPTPTPCPYDSTITADNTSCKPCEASTSGSDTASCVTIHKTATNTTQGLPDANNTTAQAGDTIIYTLYAKNIGKATVKDYVFEENLNDVLDYADITNLDGGSIDQATGIASWPKQDIKAGDTITRKITIKVKNPVPQTPVSSSDPTRFDLVMTNVFGNTVNINLPGSPGKTVEAAAATLPNTGPGTSLAIGATIMIVGGYFYSRSRLLAKESNLALHESVA